MPSGSAHAHYPDDPTSGVIGDALLRELQFERNRLSLTMAAGMRLRDNFTRPGNTFASHAPECAIIVEITRYSVGDDGTLAILTEMTEYARVTKRQTLIRYLAALRVATLTSMGRVAEAERAWRAVGTAFQRRRLSGYAGDGLAGDGDDLLRPVAPLYCL